MIITRNYLNNKMNLINCQAIKNMKKKMTSINIYKQNTAQIMLKL